MKNLKILLSISALVMSAGTIWSDVIIAEGTRKFVRENVRRLASEFIKKSGRTVVTLQFIEEQMPNEEIGNIFSVNGQQFLVGAVQSEVDVLLAVGVMEREPKIVREIAQDYSLSPDQEKVVRRWVQKNEAKIVKYLKEKSEIGGSNQPGSLVVYDSIQLTFKQLKNIALQQFNIAMPQKLSANQMKYLVDSIQDAYDLATGNLPGAENADYVKSFDETAFSGYFTKDQLSFVQDIFIPYVVIQNLKNPKLDENASSEEEFLEKKMKRLKATYKFDDQANIDNCNLFISVFNGTSRNLPKKDKEELIKWIYGMIRNHYKQGLISQVIPQIPNLVTALRQVNEFVQSSRSLAGIRRSGGRFGIQPGNQPNELSA